MSVIVPARSRLGVALRDQRLIKPQGLPLRPSKIDWSHPLARGMVGCWLMSQTDGAQFHDLAQFNDGLISGDISKVITERGPAAYVTNDGTSDRINLGSIGPNNPLYMPNDQVSAFVYTILGGSVTHGSGYPRLIDKSSSGYAAGGWAFYVDFSVNRLEFDWGASNQRATRDLVNLDSTSWTTLSCSVDTTTTTGRVFMQDGIELTSIGANNTGNIPASTTNAALLNWNHSTDRQWREPVACIFVWNRMLTKAEHEELHQKIAPFLVPINNTPFLIDVSAGGGGVSQELTGNSSASAVGTLGVSAEANVSVTPTGVAGSSAVGTLGVTAEINASAELSGVAATSAVGTLTAEVGGGATVALSGVAGTATVGTLTAAGQINEFVDLLGNSATGAVGTLIVVTGLQVALSGNAATGAVGTLGVTAEVNASAALTGVGSSGAVGTLEVTVPITASVELTGVGATGAIGTLTAVGAGQVWTEISPVSTIWTEIS